MTESLNIVHIKSDLIKHIKRRDEGDDNRRKRDKKI